MIQISKAEQNYIYNVLKNHLPDAKFWVFGSRVKGTAKQYSDVDIAIMSDAPVDLLALSTLEEEFANSDLLFKVDLVDWHRISKEFQELITDEYVELVGTDI